MKTIVYEETLTGRPHDTQYKKLPVTMKCGCILTSCPGHHSVWMQINVMLRTLIMSYKNGALLWYNYNYNYKYITINT